MRLNKLSVGIGVATLALIGSQSVLAADYAPPPPPEGHFYVGVSINTPAFNDADFIAPSFPDNSDYSRVDVCHDYGFDVEFGYQFTHHWGLELYFDYFGDTDIKFTRSKNSTKRDRICIDTWMIGLVGTGAIPLTDWLDLFGQAGAAYYDTCVNHRYFNGSRFDFDFRGAAFVYGVGLQFNVGEYVSIRTMYLGYEVSDHNGVRFFVPHQVELKVVFRFV